MAQHIACHSTAQHSGTSGHSWSGQMAHCRLDGLYKEAHRTLSLQTNSDKAQQYCMDPPVPPHTASTIVLHPPPIESPMFPPTCSACSAAASSGGFIQGPYTPLPAPGTESTHIRLCPTHRHLTITLHDKQAHAPLRSTHSGLPPCLAPPPPTHTHTHYTPP